MLPPEADHEKLAEVALALLHLSSFTDHELVRSWKGLSWDLTDLLYQKGWISDPKGKAKSVILTGKGEELAPRLFEKHFGK